MPNVPALPNKFPKHNRPPIAIEHVAPSTLVPDPRNARKHTPKQIAKLSVGIRKFGFTNPILTDELWRVIAGHARLEAALSSKLPTVPCIRLTGLSEGDKIALALADNKLGDMSEFDPARLSALFLQLEGLNFEIEYTGFETAEVDALTIGTMPQVDPADAMTEPKPDADAVTALGDQWLLGEHRLSCSNALEAVSYERLLGQDRADMVFTDMPYNVSIPNHAVGLGRIRHREFAMASGEMSRSEFCRFMSTAMGLMAQFSIDGSIHFQCMDWRHSLEMLVAGERAYSEYKALCVWNKGSGGMGSLFRSQHELVFVFKNGTAPHVNNVQLGMHGRYRTNVWDYPGLNSFGKDRDESLAAHPTVKPVALVADAIRDCSRRGALILDPFAGSGTTIIAAERTRRRAAAMEIDPLYVDTAVRRWQSITGKQAVLAGDGRSFAQVEVDRHQA